MSFTSQLAAFHEKSIDNVTKVKRMSSFDLFSAVVMETPVKKGVLRNNWFAQIGSGSSETTTDGDSSGQQTISRIERTLLATDLVRDIYLTNNMPYAYVVEYGGYPNPPEGGEGYTANGFSLKAPDGMVRVNALRWDSIVKNNARKVARGI